MGISNATNVERVGDLAEHGPDVLGGVVGVEGGVNCNQAGRPTLNLSQ